MPFIGHDYNSKSPCCILSGYKHERDLQALLDDHNNDRRSSFCDSCWKLEDSGIESKRQQYNRYYNQHIHLTDRSIKLNVVPVGNVCNLNCVTCDPAWSTGWIKKHNFMKHQIWNKSNINQKINYAHIENISDTEHVEFIGGETLLSRSFWQQSETLNKDTSFSMQTNGTVVLNQKQVELLKSFKKFNICFSLDGHDKIFEYLRQPATWDSTRDNITKYHEYFGKNKLKIYLTVSNLNIYYIDSIMIELFKVLPVRIALNLVFNPSEFSYDNITPRFGKIIEQNNPGFFRNRSIVWKGNKDTVRKVLQNLELQDQYSGLKFSQCMKEVYQNMISDAR